MLIFAVGLLLKASIYYFTNLKVNYRDPSDLIGNLYSLFMACFITLSEYFGIFAWLPSISDLYNSIVHRIKLFNLDNYIKTKISPDHYKPYFCYGDEDILRGSKIQATDRGKGTKDSGNNSPSLVMSDKDYWKEQKKLYENILATYGNDDLLSVSDLQNKKQVLEAISEAERNINFPTDDPEVMRLENIRLRLLREKEMNSESYRKFFEQKAFRSSALNKLEQIAEYNRVNHRGIGLNGIYNATNNSLKPLTKDEMDSIINVIKKDPNLPKEVADKIKDDTILGNIGVNNPVIKYLKDIDKE